MINELGKRGGQVHKNFEFCQNMHRESKHLKISKFKNIKCWHFFIYIIRKQRPQVFRGFQNIKFLNYFSKHINGKKAPKIF